VDLNRFWLSVEQRNKIDAIYDKREEFRTIYSEDPTSQELAHQVLDEQKLDIRKKDGLERKWTRVYSTKWKLKNGCLKRRVLVQCRCSYDTVSREEWERLNQGPAKKGASKLKWQRRAPYDFTGCLAHADVTFIDEPFLILRISGCLDHDEDCQAAVMKRRPAVPLHPHVYQVAVAQLLDGANISSVQRKNGEMIAAKAYFDMVSWDPATANHRYILLQSDSSQLYHLYMKALGIDTSIEGELNVHRWLDPTHPGFSLAVREAVFYYVPRVEREDRFIVCIATPEMRDATWDYAHRSQLILDGTFGVCSARLLLFIAMGIDGNGHGVPLALFIFSAPPGNNASHSGYDTTILKDLLKVWVDQLGTRGGESFNPYVVITDTNTRERGALLDIWPSVTLLLCKFHVRQAWKNQRNQQMKKIKDSHWKQQAISLLHNLERDLLASTDFETASKILMDRHTECNKLLWEKDRQSQGEAMGEYLLYLRSTWMKEPLWRSWSMHNRWVAAAKLSIPIEGVLPTTNHLESFNGILKRKHIRNWEHNGNRLRFDVFIHLLITRILPQIFTVARAQREHVQWLAQRFFSAAGNTVLPNHRAPREILNPLPPLSYWNVDRRRDELGQILADSEPSRLRFYPSVYAPLATQQHFADCLSGNCEFDQPNALYHRLSLHISGWAWCTCQDFHFNHQGACKHLRALRIIVERWMHQGTSRVYLFPDNHSDTLKIHERLTRLWGDKYYEGAQRVPIPLTPAEVTESTHSSTQLVPAVLELEALANSPHIDTHSNHPASHPNLENSTATDAEELEVEDEERPEVCDM
ncbi:hypothetical protein SISNIDRAFT_420811, partial [Sistotremastrum niveocremeum HHB9708]